MEKEELLNKRPNKSETSMPTSKEVSIKTKQNKIENNNIVITPDEKFHLFFQKASKQIHDEKALNKFRSAYQFARVKHGLQKRASGEPYIFHPIEVAEILLDLEIDIDSIVAALLHDVVEDTDASLKDIKENFGENITTLVDGVTKLAKIKFRSSQERMAENFRKMILAMAKDIRVIIIKLADRLHNMRTIDNLSSAKKKRIANETIDIYAPLAGRLGIYSIKSELEDLCLKSTKYEVYKEIASNIDAKKQIREKYIGEVREILESELKKYGFKNVKVYGRPKHFYSIYRKMVGRQLAFKDIHDLFAFRIIVENIKDCYEAVGVIHSMWKPMHGRFKDYIAMPKPNYYQSLHTTVIRPNGAPAEIQIRTNKMHQICEHGVAAHWAYKEQKGLSKNSADLKNFAWLRQIMETQHDVKDPNEFLAAIKVDLFNEEIFVFTPRGDVFELPVGATPLDFAFAIHSDVGLSAAGAKVNGVITPLRKKVKSGDIIEIVTSPQQKPSKDWLNYTVTSKARNKIRSFFRGEEREKSKKIGKELFEETLSQRDLSLSKLKTNRSIDKILEAAKENNLDELFIAIGYGKVNIKEIIEKVIEKKKKDQVNVKDILNKKDVIKTKGKNSTSESGVLVSGLDNILVTFGKCCNPIPGEDIFGFITRGRGVSVHRHDCRRALDLDPARRIRVSWTNIERNRPEYKVYLSVLTNERQGVLADVTMAISKAGGNIQKAQVKLTKNMKGILYFEINLIDINHLNIIIKKVEEISDTILVERQNHKMV